MKTKKNGTTTKSKINFEILELITTSQIQIVTKLSK